MGLAKGSSERLTENQPPLGSSAGVRWFENYSHFGGFMLYWAAVFFIIAIIAAVFGFGGIAVGAAGIAKVLFFVFLVLFIVSLLTGVIRRPRL